MFRRVAAFPIFRMGSGALRAPERGHSATEFPIFRRVDTFPIVRICSGAFRVLERGRSATEEATLRLLYFSRFTQAARCRVAEFPSSFRMGFLCIQ